MTDASLSAAGRVVMLHTSPRVAPGLMSWAAWRALREADAVFVPRAHRLRPALDDALIETRGDIPHASAEIADTLIASAGHGRNVVWVAGDDGDPEVARALGARVQELLSTDVPAPEIEVLAGSYDLPGATVLDLVAAMSRLRAPDGCPWDRQQTHESLVPFLLEEAYETVETIEAGDPEVPGVDRDALREELGDVLLQVVFHANVAEHHPSDPFTIDDVASGIVEKVIRRHPHVFARDEAEAVPSGAPAKTADEVLADWETLKAAEKGRQSVVEGVPLAQPGLALAAQLLRRASKGGVSVPLPEPADDEPVDAERLGQRLLALVAAAHRHGLDVEAVMRDTARALRDTIRETEKRQRGH